MFVIFNGASHLKLPRTIHRKLWWSSDNEPLLHPWRQTCLALCLASNERLARHSDPPCHHLLSPPCNGSPLPSPTFIRLLGALADKCHAFAKALHYKEMEFEGSCSKMMDASPVAVVEALIHINNQLHQHEVSFEEELCSIFCTIFQLPLKNFMSGCLSF